MNRTNFSRAKEVFTQAAYPQAPWRKQMQFLGLFSLALVFIALVAGIYLNVTARAATTGRGIQSLQERIGSLQKENADLVAQLAKITAASEMQIRAARMGFQPVQSDEMLYLLVPGYTTRQPVILASSNSPDLVSAPMLPAEYTESLLVWLRRQLSGTDLAFWEDQP